MRAAGLLRRRRAYYGAKIGVNLLLLASGWALFGVLGRSWWQLLVAVFLAVMFTQTGFIGQDAGHRQISGSKRTDDMIGRIHANLLIGLSYGWWTAKQAVKPCLTTRSQAKRGNGIYRFTSTRPASTGWLGHGQVPHEPHIVMMFTAFPPGKS